jgi:hypothetical protein
VRGKKKREWKITTKNNCKNIGRRKHPCDLEFSWGEKWGGRGILLVQHYSQVNLPLLKKNYVKVYRNVTNTSHLWGRKFRRQLAKIVQRETNSTIYLDVCAVVGTNYNLCSVGPGPKPKRSKNKQKSPKSPKSSKKECKKSYRTYWSNRVMNVALLSLMHIQLCYLSCSFRLLIYWPDGGLRNGQATQPFSLPLHDFPVPSFPPPGYSLSSRGSAVNDDEEKHGPAFPEHWSCVPRSLAVLWHTAQRWSWRQPDGTMN